MKLWALQWSSCQRTRWLIQQAHTHSSPSNWRHGRKDQRKSTQHLGGESKFGILWSTPARHSWPCTGCARISLSLQSVLRHLYWKRSHPYVVDDTATHLARSRRSVSVSLLSSTACGGSQAQLLPLPRMYDCMQIKIGPRKRSSIYTLAFGSCSLP